MTETRARARRRSAIERAEAHSPFLREALLARPELGEAFLDGGSGRAAELALVPAGDDVAVELRRQRLGLALAAALGDLAGELSLEEVTRLLSDFADRALDSALAAALDERVPGAPTEGMAVIAM